MKRYTKLANEIKDKSTSNLRYSSTFYPSIPFRQSDVYIYSRRLDRLDLLANEFYQDQTLWWVIARANNLGKGSFMVPVGLRLRIPFPIDDLEIQKLIENGLT
jgi:hypothetical protein